MIVFVGKDEGGGYTDRTGTDDYGLLSGLLQGIAAGGGVGKQQQEEELQEFHNLDDY